VNSRLHVQKAGGKADIEIVEALAKEIWEQQYIPVIGKNQVDYMLGKFQSKSAIANDIMSGCVYYIAFYEDVPCGYSALKKDGYGVFINKIYVKQGYRGRGIARAMLTEAFEYAKKNKAVKVWLTCNKYNSSSLELYEKSGFSVINPDINGHIEGLASGDYLLEKSI
jgi:diamine N-acetyltransferase